MAGIEMPRLGITWQNNILTGISMVNQTNGSLALIAGTRRGYNPAPDILDGEIWIKDYTGMADPDMGIPENRRDIMIHMKNIIVDGVTYPSTDLLLFTYYEGTGKVDIIRKENVGEINGVCPLDSGKLIPSMYIPKDLEAYVKTQPGKTAVFGNEEGKITKDVCVEELLDTTQANQAGGYASIGSNGKINSEVLPDNAYVTSDKVGAINGVCPLDSTGKLPSSVYNIAELKKALGLS